MSAFAISSDTPKREVALVGARGFVGGELIRIIREHPFLSLHTVVSRALAGQPVSGAQRIYEALTPEELRERCTGAEVAPVVLLAVPNGETGPWVHALYDRNVILVDLSSDFRLDPDWAYGQPETNRANIRKKKRITNPGCYATGIQIGLAPFVDMLATPPHAFGVSGYSGAGTKPSDKNNPELLRENIMPYQLTKHQHEAEVSHHLTPIRFLPHVASFFRGMVITLSCTLKEPITAAQAIAKARSRFRGEPLVRVIEEAPLPRAAVDTHGVVIGGFSVDGPNLAFSVTLDNLLKGAATQAIQNVNIACDLPEFLGIPGTSDADTVAI